jgi:hypothetical protein
LAARSVLRTSADCKGDRDWRVPVRSCGNLAPCFRRQFDLVFGAKPLAHGVVPLSGEPALAPVPNALTGDAVELGEFGVAAQRVDSLRDGFEVAHTLLLATLRF